MVEAADEVSAADENAVAVVGMAGRFPGAGDVDTLWHNLLSGIGGLRRVPADGPEGLSSSPAHVPVAAPVDGIELFDAGAFGFTAREAETTEPQHRLLLECSWEALERAGYSPAGLEQPVGVFAGCGFPDYLALNLGQNLTPESIAAGVEQDSISSLISYKLGLRGPSLTVQTHSSTSLVAVHLACQSLLTFECDMALAGGASLPLPQAAGYHGATGGLFSPDGRVRSLDAAASGTVMGSGAAVVVLRRLADARADGDRVYAVIRGSAVNNDGRDRAGYDAPAVSGEAAVIEAALAVADVEPASVGYVECHAAGISQGDSAELAALRQVFGRRGGAERCVLSSVKPSIGHLGRAAGVTALIRTVLSLQHRVLPATVGFQQPSPALATESFTVLTEDRPWPAGPAPRRAGVSSFGFGGTNAHVVLEEAEPRLPHPASDGPYLLTFSAADQAALNELTRRLREHLTGHPELDLADVAFTLQVSRGGFALRRAVICRDRDDALSALADPRRWIDGEATRRDPVVRLVPSAELTASWLSALATAARQLGGETALVHDLPFDDLSGVAGHLGARVAEHARAGVLEVPVLPAACPPTPAAAACCLLEMVARLWQAGCPVDWDQLSPGPRYRVELPPYPFQRRRHWIDGPPPDAPLPSGGQPAAGGPVAWRRLAFPSAGLDRRLRAAGPWLLLAADSRGEALGKRLTRAGAEVVTVRPGAAFLAGPEGDFTVRPADPGDLDALLRSLLAAPRTVVHAFSLGAEVSAAPDDPGAGFAQARDWGVDSAAALARALARAGGLPPAEVVLLTSGTAAVSGTDLRHPEHAALGSLIPWLAGLDRCQTSRLVDLGAPADEDLVLDAAVAGPPCGQLAIRDGQAWVVDAAGR